MTKNKSTTSVVVFALITVLCFGILFAMNSALMPMISKNLESGALETLNAVLPEAKSFELIYSADDSAASSLSNVADTVQSIYAGNDGMGYAINLSTTQGYTGNPIEFTLGIDGGGRIRGVQMNSFPDTKEMGDEYMESFVGQDSALPDVGLVSGVTYSSSAFKNAVADGFNALIENGLISAGEKGAGQLLLEQLSALCPAIVNVQGVTQAEEQEDVSSFNYITKALTATNGNACVYLVADGENTYLAAVNADGGCAVYNVDGEDITESVDKAIIDECSGNAAAVLSSNANTDKAKLLKLVADGAEAEQLPIQNCFNLVSDAFRITDGEDVYYGFTARPYGYSNMNLVVYYILDKDGSIVSMTADEFILIAEYFTSYTLDENAYKEGFAGKNAGNYTTECSLISGATVSSDAVNSATEDVFELFAAIAENAEGDEAA